MAGLCWLAMVLALFLSPPSTFAAVDRSWLTSIVGSIKNEYELGDTFSVAVNIPQNQDPDNLQQVLQNDPADKVKKAISQGQVYKGTRVVAAAQSQALSHVLQNIQPFIKSSDGNVLIIYSENSPNANDNGITSSINDITHNWSGYAFVFSNVADVPAQSFKHLEIAQLGLNNIFRCYEPGDDSFQCNSCSSGGDVTPSCVANTALSSQEQDTGAGLGTGLDFGIGTDMGTGIGSEIPPGSGRQKGKEGQMSKCKGRRRGSCRRRGGRKGGKRKKGSKLRKGGKREKGSKLRKGGKRKKGSKLRKGGKREKGRKLRRGRKQRRGRRGRKRGKTRRGRKGRRGSRGKRRNKRKRGGKSRKWGKRRGKRRGKKRRGMA